MRFQLYPDLSLGDAQVGVVPGGLGEVADGGDEHQRDRPADDPKLSLAPTMFFGLSPPPSPADHPEISLDRTSFLTSPSCKNSSSACVSRSVRA